MPIADITDTVTDYKRELGVGSRGDRFRVQIDFPEELNLDDVSNSLSILCHAVPFPATRPITPGIIPWMGEHIKYAAGKEAAEDIDITFRNTEDLKIRTVFENWIEKIQQEKTSFKESPENYKAVMYLALLDKEKKVVKQKKLEGVFPIIITPIDESMDNAEITETSVTLTYENISNYEK